MLQVVMIFLGLSLDSFVVMMHRGARIRNLDVPVSMLYAVIFAGMNGLMLSLGYLLSLGIDPLVHGGTLQFLIVCLILLSDGLILTTRSFCRNSAIEEKLDKDWSIKKLVKIAAITSLDTLLIGIAFGLFGVPYLISLLLAFGTTFVSTCISANVGYRLGSQYERVISMGGGIMMLVFAFLLLHQYVLLFL